MRMYTVHRTKLQQNTWGEWIHTNINQIDVLGDQVQREIAVPTCIYRDIAAAALPVTPESSVTLLISARFVFIVSFVESFVFCFV